MRDRMKSLRESAAMALKVKDGSSIQTISHLATQLEKIGGI
jgi:hypothetical protein